MFLTEGTNAVPVNVRADVMSDHYDELVSAYLDGEVTPEEAAQVEADASLLGQVRQFERVRLNSLPPVTPPHDLKERHLAAALAEFDSLAPVQQISRRSRPDHRVRWLSSVAAAAVVLAGVGVALQQRSSDSGSDDDFATAEAETDAESGAADVTRSAESDLAMEDAVEESEESSGGAADSATVMAPSVTFAETPGVEEALALAQEMGLVPAAPDGTAVDASGCSEALKAGEALTAVVPIDVAGDSLNLYVYGEIGVYRSYLVLPSCEIVDRTP